MQKLLASAGVGSRRSCEALITAGRVRVNGVVVTELGAKADPGVDTIEVDRKRVSFDVESIYLVLNKPLGYVSTVSDPHAKHTVMDLVQGVEQRVYPVGRLDADSAGLLLLTNDGDFTERLTHPSHQVPKTYRAVVRGEVPEWAASDLRKGIILEDGMTAPAEVEWVDYDRANNASIIDVSIHEGRNRQVRRMFEAIGFPVLALTRMRIGPIQLKGIAPGTWRKLHPSEVKALFDSADTAPSSLPQVPAEEYIEEPTARDQRSVKPTLEKQAERQAPRGALSEKPAGPARPDAHSPRNGRNDRESELRAEARELASRLKSAGRRDEEGEAEAPQKRSKGRPPK